MTEFVGLIEIGVTVGVLLFALLTIGLIFARLYRRASKQLSFVRTGLGGQKVIVDGGALVFPVLHDTIPVNMNTLRLEVRRADQQALITKDRMRVDVQAEFYVRVQPTEESIANAAQTLGLKTMAPEELKSLIEGKFVDALRSVAAEMEMEALHEQRVDFVQRVQTVVSEDLLKNGLELEAVSLTGFDQTDKEHFNPDNAFDAEGLTRLTEQIETRRRRRNDIEQDTEVQIRQKNLEAKREQLEIAKETEYAELQRQREVEVRKAEQAAEIAREQAFQRRAAEEARVQAEQQVQQATILSERAVAEERIDKERAVTERDIARSRAIEAADIEKKKVVELAEQDRAIAIAEKSKAQSVAEAEADRARADAVKAQEAVVTVRETAKAERERAVELVEARQAAERAAIGVTVAAEAEKQAAEDRAEAARRDAGGAADKVRIEAEAAAAAEKMHAEAAEIRYAVDAAGRRALHEADNALSAEQIAMQVRMAILKHLPDIIRESVKPMEQIDGLKIIQVDGLTNGSSNGAAGGSNGNLADQLVNSALRYRGQAPLVDALLQEIGMQPGDIRGFTAPLHHGDGDGTSGSAPIEAASAPPAPAE